MQITDVNLFSNKLEFISGAKRLAQIVIIELLTESISEERGCSFLSRLKSCRSEMDIAVAFNTAVSKIYRILKKYETELPEQEKLGFIKLNKILLDEEYVILTIAVASKGKTGHIIETPRIPLC